MTTKQKIGAVIIGGALLLPLIVAAGEMRSFRYTLAQDEVHSGNAYVVGEDVMIAGTVVGDAVAAGGRVFASGLIEDDVLAAGGQVQVTGVVGGDVRVASGDVLVTGDVGGDVAAVGGKFVADSRSIIGGDIWLAGGQAIIEGEVYGSVRVSGGDVFINGSVGGDVDVRGGRLVIGERAQIQGSLLYRGPRAPIIAPGAVILGSTQYAPDDFGGREFGYFLHGAGVAATLLALLMSIVAALVLFGVFKKYAHALTEDAIHSPWQQMLRGIVVLVVAPVIAILLLATVIGIPLGVVSVLLIGVGMGISCALSGGVFGVWVARVILKKPAHQATLSTVVWGTIALRILGFVPVVGWVVSLAFFCLGVGAVSSMAYRSWWVNR